LHEIVDDGKREIGEYARVCGLELQLLNGERRRKMKLRSFLFATTLLFFAGTLFFLVPKVAAEDYPSKNITWIVGSKPGGGYDLYARAIGRYMEKYLPEGIHVVVENRVGAGHKIAGKAMFTAAPDGYTVGTPAMPGLQIAAMLGTFPHDMIKLTWLATIYADPKVIAVTPATKYRSIKDLQDAESVSYAMTSFADIPDAPIVNEALGIKAKYITGHKGSSDMVLAALRGDADAVMFSFGSARKHILAKKIIPLLLVGAEKRNSEIPDVPTLAEMGYPDMNEVLATWRLIAAPPGMAEEREKMLRDLIWKTLHDEELQAWSKKSNRPVVPKDGETTSKIMKKLIEAYSAEGGYMTVLKRYMK
jgi:tripartite-type tricarboxylate transporter receptor subunit TctC